MEFKNLPDRTTPIKAENLNKLNDVAIDTEVGTHEEKVVLIESKNLFDGQTEIGAYSDIDGSKTTSTSVRRNVNKIKVKPNTNYVFSQNGSIINIKFYYLKDNGELISTEVKNESITTPTNCYYINFYSNVILNDYSKLQLEEGTTVTPYEPYKVTQIYANKEKYTDTVNVGIEPNNAGVHFEVSKNVLQLANGTTTINGITVTTKDGIITLNGTATASTSIDIFPTNTIPSGRYKLIGCPSGGSTTTYYLTARYDGVWGDKDTGNGAILSFTTFGKLSLSIANGTVCNNMIFKPMITKDMDATYTTYEPYIVPSIKVNNNGVYEDIFENMFTQKTYTKTIDTNSYVSPYGAYGSLEIPKSETDMYGDIIIVQANNQSNAPMPVKWVKSASGNTQITLVSNSNYRDMTIRVIFCKFKINDL